MAGKSTGPKHALPDVTAAPLAPMAWNPAVIFPDRITPVSTEISFAVPLLTNEMMDDLKSRVPGIVLQKRRGADWLQLRVPNHGFDLMLPWFDETQTPVLTPPVNPRPNVWPGSPIAPVAWEQVKAVLDYNQELKSGFADGFILDYQKEGVCFAAPRTGTLLHHPTGSGKTFVSIVWALLHPGALLIVTRAPTRNQYARQVERFTHLRAFVCKPAGEVRKRDKWKTLEEYYAWAAEEKQRPVVVVGWESLPDWYTKLTSPVSVNGKMLFPPAWTSIIFDESHTGRNKKRWSSVVVPPANAPTRKEVETKIKAQGGYIKADSDGIDTGFLPLENTSFYASKLSQKATRRLATTATPIPDRVRGLWAQLDLLEPFSWGSFRSYALRYCDGKKSDHGDFLDDGGFSNGEELAYRFSFIKHHVSSEVSRRNLPAKRREAWYIPVSQQVKTTGWKSSWKKAQAGGAQSKLELELEMAAASKRAAVVARIAEHMESGHKVVAFSGRRKDCEELAEALRALSGPGAPKQVWCGHGGESQAEREKMIAEYAAHPGQCVLVGTGQTMGTGIDGLQCTDAVFFVLLPYEPGMLDQWEGRFTRHGQDRPVVIYYPIAERTADERIAGILIDKMPAVEMLAYDEGLDGAAVKLMGKIEDPEAFAKMVLSGLDDTNDDLWG